MGLKITSLKMKNSGRHWFDTSDLIDVCELRPVPSRGLHTVAPLAFINIARIAPKSFILLAL